MLEFETQGPDMGRQVLSIRTQPSLKNSLSQEAMSLGITLSQHAENIISTREKIQKDLDDLRKSCIEKDKEIERIKQELVSKSKSGNTLDLLSDERLLYLFSQLKDKDDIVENAYGKDFAITYDKPENLLKAILYSIKLKQ